MAEISAAQVKELREKTGAGMLDCKRALGETGGDLEGAVDWLRKKGLATAAKKAGRVAAEGLVGVSADGPVGALIEVNAETDFVGRNETFQGFVAAAASLAIKTGGDLDALKGAALPGGTGTAEEELTRLIATIGENMTLRRAEVVRVGQGLVASYIHNAVAPNLGRIGVLVALESSADPAKLADTGKQLAMHVAAANPLFLDRESVDQGALDRERDILADQARASGKPAEIIDKMVEGRLRKYYEEVVMLEQVFVIDGERKVAKVVEDLAKDVGAPVKLAAFRKFVLGEGIEKQASDFAAEVAELTR